MGDLAAEVLPVLTPCMVRPDQDEVLIAVTAGADVEGIVDYELDCTVQRMGVLCAALKNLKTGLCTREIDLVKDKAAWREQITTRMAAEAEKEKLFDARELSLFRREAICARYDARVLASKKDQETQTDGFQEQKAECAEKTRCLMA